MNDFLRRNVVGTEKRAAAVALCSFLVLPTVAAAASAVAMAFPQTAFAQKQAVPAPLPPASLEQPGGSHAPAGPPPPGDPFGPDFYQAISNRQNATLSQIIKKGGKVDGTNWLGITPLMWAAMVGNTDACSTLVAAGAKVDALSPYGTALSYAAMEGTPTIVGFLLDHGATANPERVDGISPLMTAAETGNEATMRLLLSHKANVNAKDGDGATPLIFAARRGQAAAVALLLRSGATVAASDSHRRNALMYAAQNGHAGCVAVLLKAAPPSHTALLALVNQRDKTGETALMLNARYSGSAEVAQNLLRAGSDRNTRDTGGRTAFEIARAREYRACAAAVAPASSARTASAVKPMSAVPLPDQAGRAAARALALLDHSTETFSKMAACTSCHHQGLGLMASGLAKERGFAYSVAIASAQVAHIMKDDDEHAAPMHGVIDNPALFKHIPTVDIDEFSVGSGFLYSGLLAQDVTFGAPQADALTILAAQQSTSGQWGFHLHREPVQSSAFTTTAFAIRLLKAKVSPEKSTETATRLTAAKNWLLTNRAVTSEDRTFRLLALKWVGGADTAAAIKKATADVVAAQLPDGGWGQFPLKNSRAGEGFTRSDAYATGQALYALHLGGDMPTTNAAYQKGVRYLLRMQDDDGSWFVNKRAMPVNNYFDAGFPHGESQYISYSATCWASMALMLAGTPPPQTSKPVASSPVAGETKLVTAAHRP